MASILIISADDKQVQTLITMLPVHLLLEWRPGLAAGLDGLRGHPLPKLLLVQADSDELTVQACQQLHAALKNLPQHVPLLALIASAETRAEVLAAGADDYLLLPLLPADVATRLEAHLNPAFAGLITLLDTLNKTGSSFAGSGLETQLEQLAHHFKATAAWLMIARGSRLRLVGSHNLPPMLQNAGTLQKETERCVADLSHADSYVPKVTECPYLSPAVAPTSSGLKYHLSVPFVWNNQVMGLLKLAYAEMPSLSALEQQRLLQLSQSLGSLISEFQKFGETQILATQNALLVMIAQMISEQRKLDTQLGLVLEQSTPILNAVNSEIWLLSRDELWLTLHTSLSRSTGTPPGTRRPSDAGLLGWVVQHRRLLYANLPTNDPRFASSIDRPPDRALHNVLIAPLYHRDVLLGVLAMYAEHPNTFTANDGAFLEGIAALTASALVNTRMVEELRDHADQQRILYEMSQQIASGLDLNVTLERALHWLQRLSNTETGLLWLAGKSSANNLKLMTYAGLNLPTSSPVFEQLKDTLATQVIESGQPLMTNDPQNHPVLQHTLDGGLKFRPVSIIALPVQYQGQVIGVVCLINKINGLFDNSDLTLLSTATDMVAVAIDNAQLHNQTLKLITEREELHNQMLQTERLATVGRLTASLSHEINNPMQAIQGALALALEELDNPAEVESYLRLSLQESARVVTLVDRMRQIYRPQTENPKTADFTPLLQEALGIAQKELTRQKVQLKTQLASTLAPVKLIPNQIHLVFLSFILNFADAIGTAGGGKINIRTFTQNNRAIVEFLADASKIRPDYWRQIIKPDAFKSSAEISFGLLMGYDIVVAHNGQINCRQVNSKLICTIELPIAQAE